MLESILDPFTVKKRPYEMFLLAISIAIISVALAVGIKGISDVGFLSVAFMCIGAAPLMVRVLQIEEREDEEEKGNFFERHRDIIEIYGYYFVGVVIAVSLLFFLLPPNVSNQIFESQANEVKVLRGSYTGMATGSCGFTCLAENNLIVVGFALLFSFLFGAGAVFIITWNASIIGVLIGMTARTQVADQGAIPGYLMALLTFFLKLTPHGAFEIGAYFLAGMSGGILSAYFTVGHGGKKKQVFRDVVALFALSMVFIFLGAFIEAS